MSEQVIFYFFALTLYVATFSRLRQGLVNSTSWFCLLFVIAFSENALGFMLALFGMDHFLPILISTSSLLHCKMLLVSMMSAWLAHFSVRKLFRGSGSLRNLPTLQVSSRLAVLTLVALVASGAGFSILLAITGYSGYFIRSEFHRSPPAWLDSVEILLAISNASMLLLMIKDFGSQGKLSSRTFWLTILWLVAGVLSGFKLQVMLPGIYLVVAGWINGRVKPRYLIALVLLITFAYAVIEPMRDIRRASGSVGSFTAASAVFSGESHESSRSESTIERLVQRIDYSVSGIKALEMYESGRLELSKERIDEYFALSPFIAVIPRAFWPDKPLANIGSVLSYEIYRNPNNAVSPSSIVVSYIWGGYFGVIINTVIWSIFVTLGGQILLSGYSEPEKYAPFLIFALTISIGETIMAAYHVYLLRYFLLFGFFYYLGRNFRIIMPPRTEVLVNRGNRNSMS